MTRKRKSRKPGLAPVSTNKEDKKKLITASDKKPKKVTGKKPGSRQTEAMNKGKKTHQANVVKDPRVGSKTPIALGNASVEKTPVKKQGSNTVPPVAAVKVIDNSQALEQELYAIEDDQHLQDIIAKQEQELPLTNDEVDYFNEKMERHQAITAQLGWQEEASDDEVASETDEDALWDKLDHNHLSDYE